jgi:hypothetical protein
MFRTPVIGTVASAFRYPETTVVNASVPVELGKVRETTPPVPEVPVLIPRFCEPE